MADALPPLGGLFYRSNATEANMVLRRRTIEKLAICLDLNFNDMVRILDRLEKLDNAMQKELIIFLVENITH